MSSSLVVEELLIMLGLDTDDESFKKTKEHADKVTQGFEDITKKAALASAAVYGAIAGWVTSFASAADETSKLSRRVNGTVEQIQELDYIADRSNVSISLMRNSIEKLNAKASDAAKNGGEMAKVFQELGINAKTFAAASPGDQFDMIADAFDRIPNQADKTRLAMKLFEEEGKSMVTVFENGSEGLRQMREDARNLGLFSKADAERAEQFNDSMTDVKYAFNSIRNEVAAKLMPVLIDVMKWFKEFFIENRKLISSGIIEFFKGAAVALKVMAGAAALFTAYKLGAQLIAIKNYMKDLTIASLALDASVLLIPILVGVLVAAVAILVQDLYRYFNGMDSAFGRMAKKFPIVQSILDSMRETAKGVNEILSGLNDVIYSIFNADGSGLESGLKRIYDVIKKISDLVWNFHSKTFPELSRNLVNSTGLASLFGLPDLNQSRAQPGFSMAQPYYNNVPVTQLMGGAKTSTMNYSPQFTFNGIDLEEAQRRGKQDWAFATKTLTSGIER